MLLRNKDKEALLAIFATATVPMEVWAYGSRVTGEAHDGSDLDLVIRTPNLQKLPQEMLLELRRKIQYSNIPILVELFDWARLPETFHRNIEEKHEVLFSSLVTTLNESQAEYPEQDRNDG